MECKVEQNKNMCTCTYSSCDKTGICCECVKYHRDMNQIPGCFFPPDAEKTYDRSIKKFIEVWKDKV
jgi:hypothetical protein